MARKAHYIFLDDEDKRSLLEDPTYDEEIELAYMNQANKYVKVLPLRPDQVSSAQAEVIPGEYLEAFNQAITKNWDGRSATFTFTELEGHVRTALRLDADSDYTQPANRAQINSQWYTALIAIYESIGWKIEVDRPGYNESYSTTYTVKKKISSSH